LEHQQGVLDAFVRRLPPRSRDDFSEYLDRYRLPNNARFSDLALLAYTGGKLPSDGFEFCADLDQARPPFELVIEIAGFRYQDSRKHQISKLMQKCAWFQSQKTPLMQTQSQFCTVAIVSGMFPGDWLRRFEAG